MLDSETKRRIDTARDILVGKVPDPKSQVEQITIALIYKFMDDMDMQSVEMGGKRSFFKGKFEEYSWSNIFNPRLGGIEMLALYGEAITSMNQNANLPELFRNIFKNAYLPYRDPETLKLFLKTINEFNYDHSEKLGDAFEYLLSVLGSQGDAGQFRTPRHIIDFMVQVVGPNKNETVLDPACRTAGFLISAYKYILRCSQEAGKPLTTQEKQRLYENFTGYDISPDMVRLSLVNLYLHGFVKPQIHEYDTLTSEERWNEYADVILANPPFMSPKGGILPHKKFSVQSNRSEVLFVDYMAEHLTPNGRAAIIVPEGIIFQSAGAYKQLRKYLIEQNYLWAVVSLPTGVFNPYAGVKTSILFLDKALAKKTDQVLFVKVEADGFDLGAQRRPIDKNDLPDALNTLHAWKDAVARGASSEAISTSFHPTISSALLVSTFQLAENDDYNLSADRYREVARVGKQTHPMVKLGDIDIEIIDGDRGVNYPSKEDFYPEGYCLFLNTSNVRQGFFNFDNKQFITKQKDEKLRKGKLQRNDVVLTTRGTVGNIALYDDKIPFENVRINSGMLILRVNPQKILSRYIIDLFESDFIWNQINKITSGSAQPQLPIKTLVELQIPLPPLETQRQIVDEIATHQRIIDGARQVVEGWKPNLKIDDEWEKVTLENVCEITSKISNGKSPSDAIYIGSDSIQSNTGQLIKKETIREQGIKGPVYYFEPNVVLYSKIRPNLNKVAFVDFDGYCSSDIYPLKNKGNIDIQYLKYFLLSPTFMQSIHGYYERVGIPKLNREKLFTVEMPLPPLEVQREIVARIESERKIVEGNRELIRIYEEKIKKVIERVWEG